jgi:tripartite-type tricarboxylate transporter receptor subunit TctC
VVDNRPGAGTNLGTQQVIKAPADGYTILFVSVTTVAANASLYPELTFNFLHDVAPVANVCSYPLVLAAHPDLPVKTLPELIAYAKANPGKLNMASAGVGTAPHLFGELFNMMAGVKLTHVPYRGNFIPDLLGGQVQVAFGGISVFEPHFRSGKLLGLGVTSAKRSPALPNIPAIGEDVPGYEAIGWYGIGAPKGTSADIVATLNGKTDAAIAKADVKARLGALGFDTEPMAPAAFGALLAAETDKWAKVIKFAGIKAD